MFTPIRHRCAASRPVRCSSGAAFLLVVGSYLSLTSAYDLLAVRTLGLGNVSYRTAALASFVSYPIAHGTGAVLPVSAAIRYRIYSAHGVGAGDVARIFPDRHDVLARQSDDAWIERLWCRLRSAFGPFRELPSGVSRTLAMALLIRHRRVSGLGRDQPTGHRPPQVDPQIAVRASRAVADRGRDRRPFVCSRLRCTC